VRLFSTRKGRTPVRFFHRECGSEKMGGAELKNLANKPAGTATAGRRSALG